jgi:hypothetical protein
MKFHGVGLGFILSVDHLGVPLVFQVTNKGVARLTGRNIKYHALLVTTLPGVRGSFTTQLIVENKKKLLLSYSENRFRTKSKTHGTDQIAGTVFELRALRWPPINHWRTNFEKISLFPQIQSL